MGISATVMVILGLIISVGGYFSRNNEEASFRQEEKRDAERLELV